MEQEIQFSLETKMGDGIRNECRNKISKKNHDGRQENFNEFTVCLHCSHNEHYRYMQWYASHVQ